MTEAQKEAVEFANRAIQQADYIAKQFRRMNSQPERYGEDSKHYVEALYAQLREVNQRMLGLQD